MEKVLKLYKYIDGVNDTPFPNEEQQVITSDFRYDVKRMGGAPIITCTILHVLCLDKLWDESVYAYFNGERFFIKQVPTSSYAHTDSRYKHELELVSERVVLDNVYVYDVVDNSAFNDKPVSHNSKFAFFGTIHEFAERLNQSLQYSKLEYRVVVDDGISSEAMMVSFQDQFFSNAIQESYNTYNVPYYFEGKTIHFGYTNNAITRTFRYGKDESLLSIQKQNANYKIVNRVTGIGSADNIPYYYPNDYESKEEVEANGGTWVNPQPNLMPSIYRESLGNDRFYEALNNKYKIPDSNEYYEFANPYTDGNPKEHIVNFDNIKPTIKGVENASGYRIDMFSEFAYDANDNDEVDKDGNYLHPYFFAKLRKFDGDYGFNLFDHAIDEQEMVISMTSGSCGACEWIIGVDETSQKNTVQVNSSGNLVRDDKGNIKFGTPQDRQNDTRNYEVWVALKKDINTFGVIMPNASSNYKPSVNDTFVILHIDLPKAYILSAENNLKEQLIKYMAMNNSEKFTFSISFSRIFFAENPQILAQLNENARIQIEYDNTNYELYVSSYSYNMSNGSPLPEIKVELSDTLSVQQNALQNAISEVKQDIMSSVGSGDFLKQGLAYFLRKDTSDRTRGKLSSDVGFEVGRYVSGASGAIIYKDSATGQTVGELDKLYVRMKAYFETLVISEVNTISGKQIISPAGSIKCIGVDEIENAYRCYFLGEQDGSETSNLFHVNDQAYSQTFNAKQGVNNKISNTYYWRLITNVSSDLVVYKNQKCHYIDLSKTDCDNGSDIPKEGDIINHRGSRTDVDRMNFIESSSVDAFSPNITLFHGVNSYSLDGKDYVSYGVDKTTNKAYMNVYGDMFVGDRNGSTYMRYTPEEGLVIKGKLDIETKLGDSTLKDLISASTPEGYQEFVEKVTQDIEGLQQQIDGAIESYFYQYEPTLSNYPASSWNTKKLKDAHLNDTFTNLVDGRSWRWTIENGNYKWTEITDTATTQALALAGQAQDTADGKRRVFVAQPKPPYDKGDLWSRGKDYPLLLCVNAKGANGSYDESDWDYADNTEKLQKELEDLVNDTKDELNNAIGQATEAANTYTDNAKSALQTSIDELNKAKASVNDVYTKAQSDGLISKAEEDAINAAKQQADAAIALSETIVKAYADGVVDAEEAARIKQAAENLASAKQYAEAKANEAFNNAMEQIAGYEYLKEALKEDTTIEGGLIQSSLIKLGYTGTSGYVVMAGSNGTLDSRLGDKSIAFWAGGDMLDRENGSNVSNAADFLVRMDGSGYAAGGNLSWDIKGKITADPMSFFVGEDTVSALLRAFTITYNSSNTPTLITPNAPFGVFNVNGAATFANTLSVNGDITAKSKLLLGDIPMYKSKDGVVYIDGNLVVKGGVTMYGVDSADIPSIIKSLPIASTKSKGVAYFDADFFSVSSDGKVSFIGETGGGLDITALQNYLTQNSYLNATEGDNRYLKLSGGSMGGDITLPKNQGKSTTYSIDFFDGVHYYLFTESGVLKYGVTPNVNTIIHSGNYSNYALPLSGGVVKGVTTINGNSKTSAPLEIETPGMGYNGYIKFASSGTTSGYLGMGGIDKPVFRSSAAINYTLWHSGNDGVDSGLDADLLDGLNSSDFSRSFVDIGANNYKGNGLGYTYATAAHGGACAGGFISFGDTAMYGCQINGDFGGKYLYFRGINEGSFTSWKQIAFTDSNVASATKLQTARTIWGQSFDGTADIKNANITLYKNESSYTGGWAFYINVRNSNNDILSEIGFCGGGETLAYTYIGGKWDSPKIAVLSNGNVGIGTASPDYKLDVNGSASINGNAYIGTSSSTTLTLMRGGYNYIKTPESGSLVFNMNGSSSGLATSSLYLGGSSVILGYNGAKVGIGVSPTCALHVSGDILATGGITTNDSVTINGIKLSKSKDGVLYLDGNLVVKGGITMYGTNSTTAPSIFDSLPIASTTTKGIAYFDSEFFSVGSDGKVTFIGKTDGFNAIELQNYLTQNSYLNTTSGDNRYLKLSGGDLNGALVIKTSVLNPLAVSSNGMGYKSYIYYQNGTSSGNDMGGLGFSGKNVPSFRTNSADGMKEYKLLHENNYSSYALPLSGGTLTGSNAEILKINRTSGNPLIQFQANGSMVGSLGVNTGGEAVFVDSKTYTQRLWHSGNDGVDSGLDADLLDGKEGSWYIRNVLNFQEAKGTSTSGGYDLNVLNGGLVKNYAAISYWANAPVGFGYGMVLNLKTSSSNSLLGQLAWDVNHNSTTDTTRSLHWRTIQNDTKTEYAKWHQIAFTDSNVESATKLQKARTIWGKSFDGTSDIDGIFRSISSDITSGSPFHKILAYPNSPYGLITRLYTNGEASLQAQRESDDSQTFNLILQPLGGNVGIGTPSPSYNLDVNGTFRCNSIVTDVGSPVALLNVKGIIATTDYIHLFVTGGTNKARPLVVQNGYGNVGIGVAAPTHKLHVVGNTYLNGDVFADELNTFDVLPRTSATYDLGNSSYKWNNVYASSMIAGYIHGGGSALYLGNSDNSSYIYIREDMKASSKSWSLTTSGTMSLSGDLTSGSYGSNCVAKFQGIGSGNGYSSVVELITNNEVSISYSNNSRYSDSRRWSVGRASSNSNYRFNFWNASYNGAVSYIDLNGNFWVAGGITMYSDRRKKTILRDVELSLKEVVNAPLVEHYYNSDDKKTIHVGSIAQYWANMNDWFCKLDSEGYYTMEIQNAALASAISIARELDRYETKTDKAIKKLKKRIIELEDEVERLKCV